MSDNLDVRDSVTGEFGAIRQAVLTDLKGLTPATNMKKIS